MSAVTHPYVLLVSSSPKFHFASLQRFQTTRHFETNALNNRKMTLNAARLKFPRICASHDQSQIPFIRCTANQFQVTGSFWTSPTNDTNRQEAQGLGALLDKMEDNDHINWITQRSRCIFHTKTCRFRGTKFLEI